MTNKEKFDILAQRIKENAQERDTYNGIEYNIWRGCYYLQYREVNGNRTIFIEKETEVIGDKYIDYWCESYSPNNFDFEEFSDLAGSFLDLYEDLIE